MDSGGFIDVALIGSVVSVRLEDPVQPQKTVIERKQGQNDRDVVSLFPSLVL